MEGQKIWSNILSEVKSQVSSSTFKTWFSGSFVLDFKKGDGKNLLIVALKNSFLKEQVEARYKPVISQIANRSGDLPFEIIFVVAQKDAQKTPNSEPLFSGTPSSFIINSQKAGAVSPNHTFENFVVGASNQIAFWAAKQVAENLGSIYNPLLIYGPSGVGKTHLLQAIANLVLGRVFEAKVIYASCEKFTNDYIDSLNNKTQAVFRQKYRSANLLLVDDIQFLSGKESTQDEFFHTFNELLLVGSQVVIACDRHPKELGRLKERLVSRFLGGMVVDIGLPDMEMKMAILKSKCQSMGVALSKEALVYVAENCSGGARELEGVLISTLAISKLSGGRVLLEQVREIVEKNRALSMPKPGQEEIVNAVCRYFNLRRQDLCSLSRKKHLVLARQMLMYLLRRELGLPLAQIGEIVGRRDHSTVIYAIEKVEGLITQDRTTSDNILRLKDLFNNGSALFHKN